jgi:uroporphyrinogen III methyltransferase / synthase
MCERRAGDRARALIAGGRGKVFLVGAGPGDPGLLTLKAARALANAEVLVYDYLAAPPIVERVPPECERIYVGKKAGAHTMSQEEITALLVRLGKSGKRVVRLKGGDVFVFARGVEEAQALHDAGVPFEVVPGITSALAAPAYAGIPATHRDHNTSFTIATGHEDPAKGPSSLDFAKLANPAQTLIFLMAMGNLRRIAADLMDNGMPPSTPVAVIREGTKPQQETLVASLATVADEVERAELRAPAIVVIGNVVRERERMRWFDEAPLFGKRVLVTRPAGAGDAFAARLWELGAEPVLAPTIAIGPPDDARAAEEAVCRVRDYAWLAFTSANAVASFFDRLSAQGGDARRLGDVRVASIGPATAEALRARGVRPDFVPERHHSEGLADGLLQRTEPGDRILVYRAQDARDVLPETLRAQWRNVDVVAAYRTRYVEDPSLPELAETTDVWTFTSASTVHGFVRNVPGAADLAQEKTVACIGPISAAALEEHGMEADVIAHDYTVEDLALALVRRSALR